MSLNVWLEKLAATPHYTNIPAPTRLQEILTRLELKKSFFMITIAGTNGKGTTAYLLANYYYQQGMKVGLFTSPHLHQFNERIWIAGRYATDEELSTAFEKIKAAQQDTVLTYFDYAFLASLLLFKKHKVDLTCIEVGIGGRLDSTNALDADFAIITTIDFDHMAQLGNTRAAIGLEKAGIMRPNVPCVCGDLNTPTSIKEYAKNIQAKLFCRQQDFTIIEKKHYWSLKTTTNTVTNLIYPKHIPSQNAATALMSILKLTSLIKAPFDSELFNKLLDTLSVPGRMQIVKQQPQILVDVAHNAESVCYLAKTISIRKKRGSTYALFSALADKDIAAMLKPITPLIDYWYLYALKNQRAASLDQLKKEILFLNPTATIKIIKNLEDLIIGQSSTLQKEDRLIVFGSFILVDDFLKIADLHNIRP
jgi:dihydrofolate synthase/folylpolyglutamate synthase